MHLKILPAKPRPYCLGLNVLGSKHHDYISRSHFIRSMDLVPLCCLQEPLIRLTSSVMESCVALDQTHDIYFASYYNNITWTENELLWKGCMRKSKFSKMVIVYMFPYFQIGILSGTNTLYFPFFRRCSDHYTNIPVETTITPTPVFPFFSNDVQILAVTPCPSLHFTRMYVFKMSPSRQNHCPPPPPALSNILWFCLKHIYTIISNMPHTSGIFYFYFFRVINTRR